MKNSVIYIVGATVLVGGAYLFLKNKKAKDLAELDTLGRTTSGGTTSDLSTTSDGVAPSDANINLSNAVVLMGKIKDLKAQLGKPFKGTKFKAGFGSDENRPIDWTFEYTQYRNGQDLIPKQIKGFLNDLDNLDYALDSNNNLVKLDPNRNKEWIKIQKLYLSLVNLLNSDRNALISRPEQVKELANYGYKIDPITKQLVKI